MQKSFFFRPLVALAAFSLIFGSVSLASAKSYANLLSQPDWFKYGVNPWDKDTDNDGLTDDWEVKNGWCPTYPDRVPLEDMLCKKGSFDLRKGTYVPPAGVTFYPPRTFRPVASCNVLSKVLTQPATARPALDRPFAELAVYGGEDAASVIADRIFSYSLNGSRVKIISLNPATATVVSTITLSSSYRPEQLWLEGEILAIAGPALKGRTALESATMVELWNVHTPAKPVRIRTLTFSGDLIGAHQYDGSVYMALVPGGAETLATATGEWNGAFTMPELLKGLWFYRDLRSYVDAIDRQPWKVLSRCTDVEYLAPVRNPGYLEIVAVALRYPSAAPFQKTFWGIGAGDELYFSTSSLYIASPDNNYAWLSGNAQERTEIYAFTLGKKTMTFRGSRTVPGTIVPGALDEYRSTLRVGTTLYRTANLSDANNVINSIYFLDANLLNRVAWFEGFAPYERLTDIVFAGERLYVKTDRLDRGHIVIQFGADKSPRELGRLPAVGLSVLRPLSNTTLVGIGVNSVFTPTTATPGFTWQQGLKMVAINAAFADSFSESPAFLGDRGSLSPAVNDERMLLTDAGYIAFPAAIATLPDSIKRGPAPTSTLPSGALYADAYYVYRALPDQAPVLLGTIDHGAGYMQFGPATITNAFIRGNYLYTQSSVKFMIHSLPDLTLVKEIVL